jgi:geranylgeranyl pyrophosphate synthase
VVDAVRHGKGPQLALDEARHHAESARENLNLLDRGEATAALASLADYVVSRKL